MEVVARLAICDVPHNYMRIQPRRKVAPDNASGTIVIANHVISIIKISFIDGKRRTAVHSELGFYNAPEKLDGICYENKVDLPIL
jgi:hypothetical protein